MLPSSRQTATGRWNTFEEAKAAFDRIVPNRTTVAELEGLGFSPLGTTNVRILTYLNIIQRFMINPSIRKEDLDEGLQVCLTAKANCRVLEFQLRHVEQQRHGGVFADLFKFKRKTQQTGWEFEAMIAVVDNVVVYKLWSGRPSIDETREISNPLGPIQSPTEGLTPEAERP